MPTNPVKSRVKTDSRTANPYYIYSDTLKYVFARKASKIKGLSRFCLSKTSLYIYLYSEKVLKLFCRNPSKIKGLRVFFNKSFILCRFLFFASFFFFGDSIFILDVFSRTSRLQAFRRSKMRSKT